MEELKIYHSVWRDLLILLGGLILCALMVFLICHPKNIFHLIIGWVGVVFTGLGCIIILFDRVIRLISGQPFMKITDKEIIFYGMGQTVIKFDDVESFSVAETNNQNYIVIHYKPHVERSKMDKAGKFSRFIRSVNYTLVGGQEAFSTVGTCIKAQELCNLLNQRLKERNRKNLLGNRSFSNAGKENDAYHCSQIETYN